jgi:glyoxylase-like metal-dependent hydrolase (beta-lactamase superfamily II)
MAVNYRDQLPPFRKIPFLTATWPLDATHCQVARVLSTSLSSHCLAEQTLMTSPSSPSLLIESFFDAATSTVSHLVLDRSTRQCAVIDSVLDFDPKSGRTATRSAERLLARVRALDASVQWILETHVHADHVSAAPYLQAQLGGRVGIGSHITAVQAVFGTLFNAGPGFARDGRQFDRLFADNETFAIGSLKVTALHTPGHTPACMTYVVSEGEHTVAFVGDTLFMPDHGTARCDFPGGDARALYRSVQRVLALPAQTRLYMCHDYQPGGRELRYVSTVAEQRAQNIHVRDGIGENDFVAMRHQRDAALDMPVLLLPSVQINMRAGQWPEPEDNGVRYLKIPLDAL